MKATGYNSRISWISLGAVAIIGFLIALPMRLLGLFFVLILDSYNVDREQALIPIVTYGTMRTLSGPLVGFLGEIWGLQAIILIGCILASIGVGLSCFTEDIITLTISLGLIYGTGFSLTSNLLTSVIAQHFTDYISLTNGIYLTSSAMGAIVMTQIIYYLKNLYGTSGMFLILSGIFLNTIPAAMFLKNPRNEERESQKNQIKINSIDNNHNIGKVDREKFDCLSKKEKINGMLLLKQQSSTVKCEKVNDEKQIQLSEKEKIGYLNEAFESKSEGLSLNESKLQMKSNVRSFTSFSTEENQNKFTPLSGIELLKYSKNDSENCNNSLMLINDYNVINSKELVSKHSKKQDVKYFGNKKKSKKVCNSFRLLYNPAFLLQMIIQGGHAFGYTLVLSVLIDYARDKEISTETALYLQMFLPVSEMFGSLGFNWITDGGYITRINFCIACYCLIALDLGFLIWSYNFTLMMIGYVVYGLVNGAIASIFPGIIMDNLEKDQHNMALASRFTLYGLLCPFKSPIVGYFRGHLESYDGIYYVYIGICVVCGILVKFTPNLSTSR